MNDRFELPSLERVEQMEKQRCQALESLEITGDSVKCQKCGTAVPLLGTLTRPRSNRIDTLEKQIKWIEDHSHGNAKADDLKQIKQ